MGRMELYFEIHTLMVHQFSFLFFFHQEVASGPFCFLVNSSWLLVFALYLFFLFLSGLNLYCWKGIHFSWSLDLIFLCLFFGLVISFHFKNAGFIVLLTSVLILFLFGEIRNLTTFARLNNNCFSLSFLFLSFLIFLWIGAQFPQEKFLSYARILTLYYYFLLMCILFS